MIANKKKQGFTLIELIVVIAIIGVLAAILVPAMLGYVNKSKITSANSAARNVASGAVVALVEMDAADYQISILQGDIRRVTGDAITACAGVTMNDVPVTTTNADELKKLFYAKIYQSFSDISELEEVSFRLDAISCTAVGILNGRYPGSYPIAIAADDFETYDGEWNADTALGYAAKDSSLYSGAVEE